MIRCAETLMAMYRAMRRRQGHQNWWPGDGPLEICVGAILTQNTNWTNVEKAIANLTAAGCLSVDAIDAMSHHDLAQLIRPAGYFNVKARRLKNFIARVVGSGAGDIAALLDRPVAVLGEELLSVDGIGPETADSMILYAAGGASFVVDAYTRRVFQRHGLIESSWSYDTIKSFFESFLPRRVHLWGDYHAQIVMVGKTWCRPAPRCKGCPLARFRHQRM